MQKPRKLKQTEMQYEYKRMYASEFIIDVFYSENIIKHFIRYGKMSIWNIMILKMTLHLLLF